MRGCFGSRLFRFELRFGSGSPFPSLVRSEFAIRESQTYSRKKLKKAGIEATIVAVSTWLSSALTFCMKTSLGINERLAYVQMKMTAAKYVLSLLLAEIEDIWVENHLLDNGIPILISVTRGCIGPHRDTGEIDEKVGQLADADRPPHGRRDGKSLVEKYEGGAFRKK